MRYCPLHEGLHSKAYSKNPGCPGYCTDVSLGFSAINEHAPSDADRTRSPSPFSGETHNPHEITPNGYKPRVNGFPREIFSTAGSDVAESPRGVVDHARSQRLILKTRPYRPPGSSPGPARSTSQQPVHSSTIIASGSRRSRPETSHQRAVNMNRKMRIDHIIHQKLIQEHSDLRRRREGQRRTSVFKAMIRIRDLPDEYASADEKSWGPGGLLPNKDEDEDYGEEAIQIKKVLDRSVRRLGRHENGRPTGNALTGHRKRKRRREDDPSEEEQAESTPRDQPQWNGSRYLSNRGDGNYGGEFREETLDDLDMDLLGESRDEEQVDDELDDDSADDDSDEMTEEEGTNDH